MTLHPSKYIGSNVYVQLKDHRLLTGILTVIDPFGNLLLSNVIEESKDKLNNQAIHKREIGLVSIPKDSLVNIKMDRKEWTKIHELRAPTKENLVNEQQLLQS